jgi:uncharacterized coiled-coil protein SlyX
MGQAMDEISREIVALHLKVDRLYKMVEQLSQQIAELFSQNQHKSVQDLEQFETIPPINPQSPPYRKTVDPMMQHKDILVDGSERENSWDYEQQKNLSPDLQIRRLTAQVTAAYNRIAALEEQLLAQRIHSEY